MTARLLGMSTPDPSRKRVFSEGRRLFGAQIAPQSVLRTGIDPDPQMFGNDTLSDCTAVSTYNGARAIDKLVNQTSSIDLNVDIHNVIQFYSECTGYIPGDASTDNGADIDHVMRTAMLSGIPTNGSTRLYPLIAEFEPGDLESIRNALNMFGALHFGVGLAVADQDTSVVWDTTTPGDQRQGSWGWHDLNLWEYDGKADTDLVTLLTWGGKQKATWRWVKARMGICTAMAFHQLVTPQMKTVNGLLWDDFVAANHNQLHSL